MNTQSGLKSGFATKKLVEKKFGQFKLHFPEMRQHGQIYVVITMVSRIKIRECDFLAANGFFPANLAYLDNGSLVIVFKPFETETQWRRTIRPENIEYLMQAVAH